MFREGFHAHSLRNQNYFATFTASRMAIRYSLEAPSGAHGDAIETPGAATWSHGMCDQDEL